MNLARTFVERGLEHHGKLGFCPGTDKKSGVVGVVGVLGGVAVWSVLKAGNNLATQTSSDESNDSMLPSTLPWVCGCSQSGFHSHSPTLFDPHDRHGGSHSITMDGREVTAAYGST